MPDKSFKSFPCKFEVKEEGDDRIIKGYAATFGGPPDLVGDIIEKGAFNKTIKENGPPKTNIKLLWQHYEPLGMPSLLKPDDHGLYFEAPVSKTRFGDDCLVYIKDKVVDRMSFAYEIIKSESGELDGKDVTYLKELKLFEISPVLFACNPLTDLSFGKSGEAFLKKLEGLMAGQKNLKGQIDTIMTFVEANIQLLEKTATTFSDLPLAPRGRQWSGRAAMNRIRDWSGSEEEANEKYRKGFFWYDSSAPELFGSYKLPFADAFSDELQAVPKGIFAAAAAIQGARGGVDILESEIPAIKKHIEKYYAKMRVEFEDEDIIAPWEKVTEDDEDGEDDEEKSTDAKMIKKIDELKSLFVLREPSKGTPDNVEPIVNAKLNQTITQITKLIGGENA